MPNGNFWRPKVRTLSAIAHLCWAQLMIDWIPLGRWRGALGLAGGPQSEATEQAMRLAADVEWAATRLPFSTKCLPRAMALSWMLRGLKLSHTFVFAVRPNGLRDAPDALHAWIEVGGERIIGDLPGPWIETLRLGAEP